jgi:CheY-like chemotaxis protein
MKAVPPASSIREASPFPVPPRVRVVTDIDHAPDALSLLKALDAGGAEADVRLLDDALTADRSPPVVIDVTGLGRMTSGRAPAAPRVLVAVADRDDPVDRRKAQAAGYDLVVTRPFTAASLLQTIGTHLSGSTS